MAKRKRIEGDNAPLASNPFAQLLGGAEPAAPKLAPEPDPAPVESSPEAKTSRRVVVRREKKGRGGKTVTVVEGLKRAQAEPWLPKLKRELGCSGKLEGARLVLGTKDHVRVEQWLQKAGVPNSVLGN